MTVMTQESTNRHGKRKWMTEEDLKAKHKNPMIVAASDAPNRAVRAVCGLRFEPRGSRFRGLRFDHRAFLLHPHMANRSL